MADALDDAQSENTRKKYASKFRAWCKLDDQSPLPASPAELAQALFKSADRRLAEGLNEEPYAASSVEELQATEKGDK